MSVLQGAMAKVALVPILPERNGDRYHRTTDRVLETARFQTIIHPLLSVTNPPSRTLPDGWVEFFHPEGMVYYHHPETKIVTPSDPGNKASTLLTARDALLSHVESTTPGADETFWRTVNSAELCLRVSEFVSEHGQALVEYYFIDSVARVPFWVAGVDVRELGLGPFNTRQQLTNQLTIQFWCHIDFFPSHQAIDEAAEDELLAVLNHLSVDDSTSPGSTSPYSAAECREHVGTLSSLRARSASLESSRPYRVASFARIWSSISRTRAINAWGQTDARLDSTQGVERFLWSHTHPAPLLRLAEAFCFFGPEAYFKRLTFLWNGRIVYSRRWDGFLEETRAEWLRTSTFASCIWIANMIRLNTSEPTMSAMATAAFSGAAVVISLALLQRHTKALLSTGPGISELIAKVEHPKHGLRPLAIAYSLPRALTIWSALAFQSQLFLSAADFGLYALLACIVPFLGIMFTWGVLG